MKGESSELYMKWMSRRLLQFEDTMNPHDIKLGDIYNVFFALFLRSLACGIQCAANCTSLTIGWKKCIYKTYDNDEVGLEGEGRDFALRDL